jgi:ferredoxin
VGRLTIHPNVFCGEVPPQQSILLLLLQHKQAVLHSCRGGHCGQDLIRVLKGWEQLNKIEAHEAATLALLRVDNLPMRMACCARIAGGGDVVIQIVENRGL